MELILESLVMFERTLTTVLSPYWIIRHGCRTTKRNFRSYWEDWLYNFSYFDDDIYVCTRYADSSYVSSRCIGSVLSCILPSYDA
jgi:hypothetical protein